jgi:hypothetical protein
MSALLLAIVFAGFSKTFFLRPFFQVPPIAPHVYVHGLFMTAWFALLVVQTSLVAAHRIDLHRRLGVGGALLAVGVASLSVLTVLGLPARFKAYPVLNGAHVPATLMIQIIWGDFADIALFCVLVATAVWLRHRPEAHKRLLLLASIAMIGPAIGRCIAFLTLWQPTSSVQVAMRALLMVVAVAAFALPLTLVVHDVHSERRLHPATLWGVAAYFGTSVGFQFVIASTAFGKALVIGLE